MWKLPYAQFSVLGLFHKWGPMWLYVIFLPRPIPFTSLSWYILALGPSSLWSDSLGHLTVTQESHKSRCEFMWICLEKDVSATYLHCTPDTTFPRFLVFTKPPISCLTQAAVTRRETGWGRGSLKAGDRGQRCGFDPWCDGHDGLDNPADCRPDSFPSICCCSVLSVSLTRCSVCALASCFSYLWTGEALSLSIVLKAHFFSRCFSLPRDCGIWKMVLVRKHERYRFMLPWEAFMDIRE